MSLMSVDEDDEDFKADLARAIAASLEPDITGPHTSGGTTGWNALLAAGRAASWGDTRGDTKTMGGRSSPAIIDDDDDDFQRQIAAAMAASLASAEEEWRRRSVGGCSSGGGGVGRGTTNGTRNQATRTHPQPPPPQGTANRPLSEQEREQSHVRMSSDGAVCCSSGLLLKPLGGSNAGGLGVGAKAWPPAPVAGDLPLSSGPHPSPQYPTRNTRTSSSVIGFHRVAGLPVAVAPTGTTPAAPAAVASSAPLLSTSPGKHARTPSLPGAVDSVQPSMKRSRPASDSSGQRGDSARTPASSSSGGASGSVATSAADGPLDGLAGATAPRDGSDPVVRLGLLPGGLGQQGDEAGWDSAPAHSHSLPERPASAASGCTASAAVALDTAVVDADGLMCTLPEVSLAPAGTTSDPAHACALTAGTRAAGAWGCTGDSVRGSSPAGVRVQHSSHAARMGEGRAASKASVRCSSWPPTAPNLPDATCGDLQRRHQHQSGCVDDVLINGDAWLQGEQGRYTLDLSPGSPARRPLRQHLSDSEGALTAGRQSSGTTAVMRRCGGADVGPRPLAAPLDLSRPCEGPERLRGGSGWVGLGPDARAPDGDGVGALRDAEAATGTMGQDAGPVPMVMDEPLPKPAPQAIGVAETGGSGGPEGAPLAAASPQWRYTGADRRVLLHQRVWWWLGPGQVQPGRISSIDRRSEPLLYTIRLDAYDGGRDGESVIATADCLLPFLEHGDRIMCRLPPSPSSLVELVHAQASQGWVDTGACYAGAAEASCSWVCGQLQHCIFDAAVPLVHVAVGPEGLPFTLPYEFVVPVADAAEGSGVVVPSSGAGEGPESTCMDIVPVGPCL